jgi:hypothetical protein
MIVNRSVWDYVMQVTVGAPMQPLDSSAWSFPVACMILLVPLFFVSSWIEGRMMAKFLGKKQDSLQVKKISWKANTVAYACLYFRLFSRICGSKEAPLACQAGDIRQVASILTI